jgi:hypothetical protein
MSAVRWQRSIPSPSVSSVTACSTSLLHLGVTDVLSLVAAVPDSYTGPRMIDGKITPEFVAALVEEFKAQRLVHKRYVVEILIQLKPIFASAPSLVTVGLWVCALWLWR